MPITSCSRYWPDAAFPPGFPKGWAEFNATQAKFDHDGASMFGSAPQYRAYGLLTGNPLPIEKILAGAAGSCDRTSATRSWPRLGADALSYLRTEPQRPAC